MRTINQSIWLCRIGSIWLAGVLMMPSVAAEGTPSGRSAAEVSRTQQESVRQRLNQIGETLTQARDLFAKDDFTGADRLYLTAQKDLENLQGEEAQTQLAALREEYHRFQESWAGQMMSRARTLAADGKYAEAVTLAQQAQSKVPERKSIFAFIEECQKRSIAADFRKETSLSAVAPEYSERRKEADLNLREAKLFYRNNQLESACIRLERVLLVDPFNIDAIEMLNQCYNRLYQTGKKRTAAEVVNSLARDTWEWAEPLSNVQIDRMLSRSGTVHKRTNTDLYARMERIIFPSVKMNDRTIADIIRDLNARSRNFDPQKQGVSIIDNLSAKDKQRRISFELGKTPLLDIIRYLSLMTGLSYTTRGDTVVFGNVDSMSTEFFPVRGDVIAQIIDAQKDSVTAGSAGLGGGEGGD